MGGGRVAVVYEKSVGGATEQVRRLMGRQRAWTGTVRFFFAMGARRWKGGGKGGIAAGGEKK
jgi:hypothetical protein